MKQFVIRTVVALFVLSGVLFITQTCSAAVPTPYSNLPVPRTAYVNPAYGTQLPPHPVSLTQLRTGYTRGEIRAMPMVARPNRPGHFIGNTVRRRAGVGY